MEFVEDKAILCNETCSTILNKLNKCENVPTQIFLNDERLEQSGIISLPVNDKPKFKSFKLQGQSII